jgi:ribosomal protein S27AE
MKPTYVYAATCVKVIDGAKRCTRCGETLPLERFSPQINGLGGRKAECRACGAQRAREWRERNPDAVLRLSREGYERQRRERPNYQRERIARWRAANPEQAKAMARAHAAVLRAVRRGDLVRPDACERCGRSGTIVEAHHPDYAELLVVRWLCRACHRATDKERHAAA